MRVDIELAIDAERRALYDVASTLLQLKFEKTTMRHVLQITIPVHVLDVLETMPQLKVVIPT